MGEVRQLQKFSNVSRSIEVLAELAKVGATKYNTFAISRIANMFGVSRELVRANAERNSDVLEVTAGMFNEIALLKAEIAAMKEKDAKINGFYRPPQKSFNAIVSTDIPLESLQLMQSLGMLEIVGDVWSNEKID